MAKKTSRPSVAKKLAGKAVAFVGKFGYANMDLERFAKYVTNEGGRVVDPDKAAPDFIVLGEGRGGKLPTSVIKLQAKWPKAETLDEAGLFDLFLPTKDEFLAELRAGIAHENDERWEYLEQVFGRTGNAPDLSRADLRKFDLFGAKMLAVKLDGADLRGCSAHYAEMPALDGVNLDGADLSNTYFSAVRSCSFRTAKMTKAWLAHGTYNRSPAIKYEDCDFRDAKAVELRGDNCDFINCDFRGADLSDAEFEGVDFAGSKLAKSNLTRAHASKAKLDHVDLSNAVLFRADLRQASLKNADLRNADLREAVLSGANLTGANVKGADFAGAVLTGVKGLEPSGAKNLVVPKARKAGPSIVELAKVAGGATKQFQTSVEVDVGTGEFAVLYISLYVRPRGKFIDAQSRYHRDDNEAYDRIDSPSFEQAMLNCADRWPNGTLRLASIKAKGSKTMSGKKLLDLALAAWSEAFGLQTPSKDSLAEQKANQEAERNKLRETMRAEIVGGPAGVKKWSARPKREREQVGPLHGLDLHGAKLAGANFDDCDLQGANFAKADLKDASFWSSRLPSANFKNADLTDARLGFADATNACFESAKMANSNLSLGYFNGANFRNADLTNADLGSSAFLGTDFTGAKLDGTEFRLATYDAATKFPKGFVPPADMELHVAPPEIVLSKPGGLDFATFMQHLQTSVDPSRLDKALAMLRAERFKLFSEVKDDSVVGVVRSQSSKERVYSCRLTSKGDFSCCTQNLKPCGGLQGALCKHLLVLIVGLAKANLLDPATVETWMATSTKQKPAIDKDVMSDTFLRYTGAEAGEVDWRPTETIPEDYYAL